MSLPLIAPAGGPAVPRPRKTLRLASRIVVLSVAGILLLGVCVTGVAKYVLELGATEAALERVETNMRVAWDVLRATGKTFSIVDGKLSADGHALNGNVATVDKIARLVGGSATIFMNDTRIATNVMKPDGARAVGTQLARSDAFAAVFDRKSSYRGEVQILGEPYMTAYDPILSANGELLGILYVGIKKAEFLKPAEQTFWTIIYSTLAIAMLAVIVSFFVARNSIVRPLKAAIATMNRLAQGDLTVDTPPAQRADEIDEIMTALGVFKTNGLQIERMNPSSRKRRPRAPNSARWMPTGWPTISKARSARSSKPYRRPRPSWKLRPAG